MATSTSLPCSTSCEVVPKISDGTNVNVETITPSIPSTLALAGSPAQQQQAGPRMVPLLYFQSPPSMRMGTSTVTTSPVAGLNTCVPQKVPAAIRSGTTLVTAGTQFIPALAPQLGVTPVIGSTATVPNAVVNKTTANMTGGQQHFVIQAPRNSGSGSGGTPTLVSTPGKPTIAYLGTLIKPSGGKTGEGQIVLPTGQLMQNSNQKLLLANVPLPLPHLTSTSVAPGISTAGSQQQASTKLTSLLVPMTIPTQISSNKAGMINLKIANGQIHTESSGKNPVTYATLAPVNPGILTKHKKPLPESDDTTETTRNINAVDEKNRRSQDLSKCLQEAVDAIFSPSSPKRESVIEKPNEIKENGKHKEKDTRDVREFKNLESVKQICEAQQIKEVREVKEISEINDVKEIKAMKEIKDIKDVREIKDIKDVREIKDIKDVREIKDIKDVRETKEVREITEIEEEDDEVTLIKVLPSKEEPKKEIPDDDVKIELVKPHVKSSVENNIDTNSEDFDPMNALDWKNGIGTLPGSEVKFRLNEFGMMEMVDQKGKKKSACFGKDEDQCEVVNLEEESHPSEPEIKKEPKASERKIDKHSDDKPIHKPGTSDDIYSCEGCGVHGLESEFVNSRFCSPNCISAFTRKKAAQTKRERELLQLRLRRRKKRLFQLQQLQKAQQDRDSKTTVKPEKFEKIEKKPASPVPQIVATLTSAVVSEEDNASCTSNEGTLLTRLPWQMGKSGFSWPKYLEHCKAKAAPVKLFKDPFPYSKHGFRVGMKLEGVDPEHPSYFCVLTISDVQGYRIRLHFDGYSENHDFWVNADSMDIFPPGWCEKNGHTLHPPHGFTIGNFNWATYLKQSKAQAPPRHLFMNKTGSAVCPHGFRLGMKLEAVDRKNSSLVCVATVSDLMDNRILVHFDSWDDIYDYWADQTSPYIHPVGWCEERGHALTPPNNYKGQPFSWEAYLKESKSLAAPARAFKQRPPCGFKKGMKLECVDKWVPMLIRVSSVIDVVDHQIKIHFDGWSDEYSYWIDDASPDIHPMGWCQKTGHPLEPPLTWDDSTNSGECPTPGCRGLGNAKGPKFMTHNTAANCPYALENLVKDNLIPDRIFEKTESGESIMYTGKENLRVEKDEHVPESRPHGRVGRPPKYRRLDTVEGSKAHSHDPDWRANDDDNFERKRKKRRNLSNDRSISPSSTQISNASTSPPIVRTGPDLEQLQQELQQSVLQPGYEPNPNNLTPHLWTKHSQYLNSFIIEHTSADASQWTQDDVMRFVNSIPGCENKAKVFSEQQIDGEALLMMAQEDLVNAIGLKLGPAIKLYNSILLLRQKVVGASR